MRDHKIRVNLRRFGTLTQMSPTNASGKHREVANLDRVPLPVEAARVGVTGWQLTRTGLRILAQ